MATAQRARVAAMSQLDSQRGCHGAPVVQSGGRHRLLPLLLAAAAVALGTVRATAAHSSLNATQGTWFSYSLAFTLYPGSSCSGNSLVSVSDPPMCTTVVFQDNGQSTPLGIQGGCVDTGFTAWAQLWFDPQPQPYTCSFACTNDLSVSAGTCVNNLELNGQPVSAVLDCVRGPATPLFYGIVSTASILIVLIIVGCSCRTRIHQWYTKRRTGTAGTSGTSTAAGNYLQLPGDVTAADILNAKYCATCNARLDGAVCSRCGAPAPPDPLPSSAAGPAPLEIA